MIVGSETLANTLSGCLLGYWMPASLQHVLRLNICRRQPSGNHLVECQPTNDSSWLNREPLPMTAYSTGQSTMPWSLLHSFFSVHSLMCLDCLHCVHQGLHIFILQSHNKYSLWARLCLSGTNLGAITACCLELNDNGKPSPFIYTFPWSHRKKIAGQMPVSKILFWRKFWVKFSNSWQGCP